MWEIIWEWPSCKGMENFSQNAVRDWVARWSGSPSAGSMDWFSREYLKRKPWIFPWSSGVPVSCFPYANPLNVTGNANSKTSLEMALQLETVEMSASIEPRNRRLLWLWHCCSPGWKIEEYGLVSPKKFQISSANFYMDHDGYIYIILYIIYIYIYYIYTVWI